MKIKILHIIHSLQVGGLENGVVNLINNLDGLIFDHSVCCIDSRGPMAERIKGPVSIYSLEKGDKRDYLISLKIARLVKKMKPDIIHTRNWSAIDGVIGARLAGNRSVIHSEHGREASDPDGKNNRRNKIRKAISPWVSQFVTVSSELKNWLVNEVGIRNDKVIQIMNGVDTEVFKPSDSSDALKKELGISPETFVIGSVGRLDPVKDQETLLKAFKNTISTNSSRKSALMIVGAGPMEHKLKLLADELAISDHVIFTGECEDVDNVYRCMDIYVLSSIAEGISNTVLEAMASGLPVIASSVGGNLELIDLEQTGYFFSPGSVEELAELIMRYSANSALVNEHGLHARQRAIREFSVNKMTENYASLYESFYRNKCLTAV